jgi:tetratricopeptide (TPR) repeat protein
MDPVPEAPFIGRKTELSRLREGLRRSSAGEGSFWVVSGPVGIGKSRLLRAFANEAIETGFQRFWGSSTRTPLSSFQVFEEAFPRIPTDTQKETSRIGRSAIQMVEEERPKKIWEVLRELSVTRNTLVISRDRPSTIKEKAPQGDCSLQVLHLSRGEGKDALSPTALDALGERIEAFLRSSPGSLVLVANLEFLVVQNSFLSVLRLLQFLRESAESNGGQIMFSFNPNGLEPRERALIEGEGELIPSQESSFLQKAAPTPSFLSPQVRMLAYLERLEGLCRKGPVLLVLEDLGWADPASAATLSFLVRNTRHLPVLILGATRTSEWGGDVTGNARLNESLDTLAKEGYLSRLSLAPLPPSDIRELVRGELGSYRAGMAVQERVLTELAEKSSGNPLMTLEMVRSLRRNKVIRPEDGSWALKDESRAGPGSPPALKSFFRQGLRHLILSLLNDLETDVREVLEASAIIGPSFERDAVAAALGQPPAQAQPALLALESEHRILRALEGRDGAWTFTHPYLQEVLLDNLVFERMSSLANELADWWKWSHPLDAGTIGRLYFEAREGTKGIPWLLKAAEQALSEGDGEAVRRFAMWALELVGPRSHGRERVFENLLALAETVDSQGDHENAGHLLRELLKTASPGLFALRIKRALADIYLSERRLSEAKLLLDSLAKEFEEGDETELRPLRLSTEILRAELEMLSGDPETAATTTRTVLEQLGSDEKLQAWRVRALEHLGWSLLGKGEVEEARKAFAEGRKLAQKLHLLQYLPFHCEGMGRVEQRLGELEKARAYFQEAVAAAFEQGDLLGAAGHMHSIAQVDLTAGRLPEAEEMALRSLQYSERFDSLGTAGRALLTLGRINVERKRWEDAKVNLSLAVNRFLLSGESTMLDEARLILALVHGEIGNPKGALEEVRSIPSGGPLHHLVLSRLNELVGNLEDAWKEMEAAQEEASSLPTKERERLSKALKLLAQRIAK